MHNAFAETAARPHSLRSSLLRRPRSGGIPHLVLVAAISALTLYIAASVVLGTPLAAVLAVIGLVAALLLFRLPGRVLMIADAVVLGAIVVLFYSVGQGLVAFCLAGIVGALALRRHSRGWLYLLTGFVVLSAGWSSVTMALNKGLVPLLITEAMPSWINLHLPVMVLGLLMVVVGLGYLAVGLWKLALHVDVMALGLFIAAGAHVAAGLLGFVSMGLAQMLADIYPHLYSFDENSAAMTSSVLSMLQMGTKSVVMGALIPLGLVILAVVRLVRQFGTTRHGAPLQPTSWLVTGLTAAALVVPGALILVLSRLADQNPLQVVLPFMIDGAGLALWAIAVVAWWRHSEEVRFRHAPGSDMTSTDLGVTLLLAASPGLLALFDVALTLIP